MKIAFYKWNPEGNFEQWLEENKKEQQRMTENYIDGMKGICSGAHAFSFG